MMAGESNTMFIDFAHLMRSNDLLHVAIADEYLRSCFAFQFLFFFFFSFAPQTSNLPDGLVISHCMIAFFLESTGLNHTSRTLASDS